LRTFVGKYDFTMKIMVIGASGTIGGSVVRQLQDKGYEVISVSTQNSPVTANLENKQSLEKLFEAHKDIDGVICAAGKAYAGPLATMGEEEFYKGIQSKLMGQVNLAMIAKEHLKDNGFIILTSGNLAEEAKAGSASLGLVNGAINGFVVNAALEMPRGIRLNVVSPSILAESTAKYGQSPGRQPVPAQTVADAYLKIVSDAFNGQVVKVYGEKL